MNRDGLGYSRNANPAAAAAPMRPWAARLTEGETPALLVLALEEEEEEAALEPDDADPDPEPFAGVDPDEFVPEGEDDWDD